MLKLELIYHQFYHMNGLYFSAWLCLQNLPGYIGLIWWGTLIWTYTASYFVSKSGVCFRPWFLVLSTIHHETGKLAGVYVKLIIHKKQLKRAELGEGKYDQNTLYKTLQEPIQCFKIFPVV